MLSVGGSTMSRPSLPPFPISRMFARKAACWLEGSVTGRHR